MQETNIGLGVRHAITAAASFAVMGALIKSASSELSTPMITFLRSIFGLLFLLPLLLREPLGALQTDRLPLHLLRCGVGLVAMYCFFFALAHMPLAEAMLLNYAAPLYVPLIAWFWLRERPARGTTGLVLLGLVGVAMIIRPQGAGLVSMAAIVAALAGVFAGAAFVSIRRLSSTEPAARIVFYFGLFSVIATTLPALAHWQTPSATAWLLMMASGLFATAAQISLTRSYTLIPAAQVAPLSYLVVVFAMLIGWAFWNEVPDLYSALGTILVIGSSILALGRRPTLAPARKQ